MTHLTTNPNESGESEQPGEDDNAYMEIDLEGKADSQINAKVIDQWCAKGVTKIAKCAWVLDQSVALWGSESAIWG